MKTLYIGLMSGTSMDGIDACLVDCTTHPRLIDAHKTPIPKALRQALDSLIHDAGAETAPYLAHLGTLDAQLGELFAHAALTVLHRQNVSPRQIRAIGSHGQTIWHQPTGSFPFSLQIGDPARIAERTGITTVADFRRADIAAGGQGAPLVPAFHAAMFQSEHEHRAILNIGGMANLTLLPSSRSQKDITGFDTGPGNVLLDIHTRRRWGMPFDPEGQLAASGRIDQPLLARMLSDPFFSRPPPKSTGREYFNARWLDRYVSDSLLPAQDIQATLSALTVSTACKSLDNYFPDCHRLLVCGGGAYNKTLMHGLKTALPKVQVQSTAGYGVPPEWVEAMAFAWLAHQTLARRPASIPTVTGARRAMVLGAIYPATEAI